MTSAQHAQGCQLDPGWVSGMAAESPHAARICVTGRPPDACRSLAQAWGFVACAMQWAGVELCVCDDFKHPWSSGYAVSLTRWRSPARSWLGVVNGSGQSVCCKEICDRTTHLVAMTSAQHAQAASSILAGCQVWPRKVRTQQGFVWPDVPRTPAGLWLTHGAFSLAPCSGQVQSFACAMISSTHGLVAMTSA